MTTTLCGRGESKSFFTQKASNISPLAALSAEEKTELCGKKTEGEDQAATHAERRGILQGNAPMALRRESLVRAPLLVAIAKGKDSK